MAKIHDFDAYMKSVSYTENQNGKIIPANFSLNRYRNTINTLVERLLQYIPERLTDAEYINALELFLGNKDTSAEEIEDLERNPHFQSWLLYDYRLVSTGKRLVKMFGETHQAMLNSMKMELINNLEHSYLAYYEIVHTQSPNMLVLSEISGQRKFTVINEKLYNEVVKWDILFTRIITYRDCHFISERVDLFSPRYRPIIIEALKREFEILYNNTSPLNLAKLMKEYAYLFLQFNIVLGENVTAHNNADTAGKHNCTIIYTIINRSFLHSQLESVPELKRGTTFNLVNTKNKIVDYIWDDGGKSSFARFRLKSKTLEVHCSAGRDENTLKRFIDDYLYNYLTYSVTEYSHDIPRSDRHNTTVRQTFQEEIEEEESTIIEYFQNYNHIWLELPMPALDGMTPQEAAQSSKTRPMVEQMLRELENINLHAERRGESMLIDIDYLRERLHIEHK